MAASPGTVPAAPRAAPAELPRWWPAWAPRSPLRASGACLVAVALVFAAVHAHPVWWPTRARYLAWIGLLLASFGGWGTLAVRAAGAAATIRGFVRVSLGLAALLAVAGFFLAAHVLSFPLLAALVAVGLAVQIGCLFEGGARLRVRLRDSAAGGGALLRLIPRPSLEDLGYWLAAAVVLAAAVLRLLAAAKLTLPWWDADDTPAYQAFVRELTQRGSFDQLFSFRRMVAYGGQTVLQAVVDLGVPLRSMNVFDAGICPLLMTGILLQVGRRQWLGIASALLVTLLPTLANNSASNFSGSLFYLVLFFALRFASSERTGRSAALVGVVAAALCTLRHSFIPGGGVLLAAAAAVHFADAGPRPLRERLGFAVAAAVGFAITIAPWTLASVIATHTPLFPLFAGTYRGGGLDLGVGGDAKWLDGLKGIFDEKMPAPDLLVMFAALLALGSRLSRASFVPLAVGALASTILLVRTAPFNPGDDVRYLAAPWIGLMVAFYCEALLEGRLASEIRAATPGSPGPTLVGAIAIVLVALQLAPSLSPGIAGIAEDRRVVTRWEPWAGDAEVRAEARAVQSHVPPGATILATCDWVYHFDFGRNKIVLADLPTVASPFPLPGENATPEQYEEVTARLKQRGIDFLIFSDPNRSHTMYSAPRWRSFRNDGYRTHELLVPRFLAWLEFENYLAAHRPIVASAGIEELVSLR